MINDIPLEFQPFRLKKNLYKPMKKRKMFFTIIDGTGSTEARLKDYSFPVIGRIRYAVKEFTKGNMVFFQGEDGAFHFLDTFPSYLELRETLVALKDKVLSLKAFTEKRRQLGKG